METRQIAGSPLLFILSDNRLAKITFPIMRGRLEIVVYDRKIICPLDFGEGSVNLLGLLFYLFCQTMFDQNIFYKKGGCLYMAYKYKAIKVNGVKHDYHRWLMERHLGRELEPWEDVHHKDLNPRNNDIANLEVVSHSDHAKLHARINGFSDLFLERRHAFEKGHIEPNRKLTEEDVSFIRSHYIPRDKEYGCRALSRRFNIDHKTILQIINGERYVNF